MNLALMPVSETVLLSKPNGNGDTMREPDTPENTTDVHIPKLGDSVQVGKYFVCSSVKFGATALCAAFDGSGTSAAPISTQIISAQRYRSFLQQEGRVWLRLRQHPHKNLPRMLGCHDPPLSPDGDDPGFLFFNPFYGDLYGDCLRHRSMISHREECSIFKILAQMIAAIHHCHRQRIVIGNLKLGKFMWADAAHQTLQLAELDGAKLMPAGQSHVERTIGCPAYVAPEILDSESYDGFAADIWALGVVAYVLATGSYPYKDRKTDELFQKIKSGCVHYPSFLSSRMVDILQSMLTLDPHDRATAAELMQHASLSRADDGHALVEDPEVADPSISTRARRTPSSMVDYEEAITDRVVSTRATSRSATASPRLQFATIAGEEFLPTKGASAPHEPMELREAKAGSRSRQPKRFSWTAGLDDESFMQALPTEKRRNSITLV